MIPIRLKPSGLWTSFHRVLLIFASVNMQLYMKTKDLNHNSDEIYGEAFYPFHIEQTINGNIDVFLLID